LRVSVNIRFALLLIILGFAGHDFAKSSPPVGEIAIDLDQPALEPTPWDGAAQLCVGL
jgi:hypothetical protein